MDTAGRGTPTANLLTGLGIDEYFTRTDGSGTSNYLTDALAESRRAGEEQDQKISLRVSRRDQLMKTNPRATKR